MIFGFLKTQAKQERMFLMGFDQFPAVAIELQLHMKKNAVMRTKFSVSRVEEMGTKSMALPEMAKKVTDAAGSKKACKS